MVLTTSWQTAAGWLDGHNQAPQAWQAVQSFLEQAFPTRQEIWLGPLAPPLTASHFFWTKDWDQLNPVKLLGL